MPEAVDVGSVLGGRYKVTAYVLASAEKDLVLDGVDQVLNRPVSILVASAGNASQVATSARELATGDRSENIQVLDLGITESGTYLVTNRTPAADMLDLIVQQDSPAQEAPYVEPFFTDTLGSEIFGRPRSTEPETYDDHDEDEYEEYDAGQQGRRQPRFSGLTRRFGRNGSDDSRQEDTSDLPPVPAEPEPERRQTQHLVPPPPTQRPGGASAAPVGSREDRHKQDDDGHQHRAAAVAGAGAAGVAGAAAAAASRQPGRAASRFPLSGLRDDPDSYDDDDHPDGSGTSDGHDGRTDDDDDNRGRKFTRVLVGVVLTIVLVVAVVLAATQIGSIFGGTNVADEPVGQTTSSAATEDATAPATPTAAPTPDAVAPVVSGVTRLVPDNPGLDAANDVNLPLVTDGNPATFWGNQVYASDTFGGLATNLALVVELEQESTISQVSIAQLNGAGGNFSVLVNDERSLEGAEQIAQGGFTAPTVTLPIPDGADVPTTGRYVIINFTQLPRLSNIQAQYPFGLRIAEITVS
ncbi:ABC transporter substrate-binding protein [Arthrobacter sp. NPDC092385]|uniref:ABC transporter substrate-binding protein n=1 Tax=Arthrobacter sp. NPDC092385 TaxID=3363943 RepID=UPI00380849CB